MAQVIIYKNDEGVLEIVRPTPQIIAAGYSVLQVAKKDVPSGKPFKIIEETVLPIDRALRAAWDWDADLTTDNDGYGSDTQEFEEE